MGEGGEPARAGILFADESRSVGPRTAPVPGSVSPTLFHGEKLWMSDTSWRLQRGLPSRRNGADPRLDAYNRTADHFPYTPSAVSNEQIHSSKAVPRLDAPSQSNRAVPRVYATSLSKRAAARWNAHASKAVPRLDAPSQSNRAVPRWDALSHASKAVPRLDAPSQSNRAVSRRDALSHASKAVPRLDAPSQSNRAVSRWDALSQTTQRLPYTTDVRSHTQDHSRWADPTMDDQRRTWPIAPRGLQGSARWPQNGGARGSQEVDPIASWHAEKATLGEKELTQPEVQARLYRLAETCTNMMRTNQGRVGDVARSLGGFLVKPPVDPVDIKRYFGELKGFPKIDELITIVSGGVPVIAPPTRADLETALRYGNHRSAHDHLPLIWKKIAEDVRRERCLVINKSAAHEIPNLRVLPLGAVVTSKKVRIINDLSFEHDNKKVKGGLNADTDVDTVPPSLCAEALPQFLTELVSLRATHPKLRILMATTDVNDAYRNVRVDPDQAHNFCYVVDNLIVIDFRLTFGWTGSPGNFGVMASAAEHAHRNTNLNNVCLLPEGERMMEHVKIVDRWEVGDPEPVPSDAKIRESAGGKLSSPFMTNVYVDDHGLIRAQQSDDDKSALVVSASLASDYVRLFGPGEPGETPILAPKKSSNWDTQLEFLGFVIDSHTLQISVTAEKALAIKTTLVNDWPRDRHSATAQEVFSIAGKLWNLTYVVRAGKYFVWRLLRLTGLHISHSKNQSHSVELKREFHDDLDFWRWAIDEKLLTAGASLSAPCYAAIKRMPKRLYLSDASFEAIGGYCKKRRVYWRYDLPLAFSAELKRKAARRETPSVTINLLELVGMVVTAWVMHELVGDRPETEGDPILMRGDNVAAVTWSNRCGGAKDKRAGLMMRMLGRLEISGGWGYNAKHIPGVQNVLADGISRWPRSELAAKVRQLTNTNDWREQPIGPRGERLCEIVLQTKNIAPRHDNMLWDLMTTTN